MRSSRLGGLVPTATIAACVLGADQLTKALALHDLAAAPLHLLGPLSLELEYNDGVAFSLGATAGAGVLLVVPLLLVVAVVVWFGLGLRSAMARAATGLILGGALGNLADRLFRSGGYVVDFVHLGFWPTFNLADSAVVVGSVLLGLALWRSRERPTGEHQ